MTSIETVVRDLHRRKARERRQLTLAEGIRLVEEVLAAGVECRGVLISPGLEGTERGRALKQMVIGRWESHAVTDAELAELASTEHPQGVLAVIRPPVWRLADVAVKAPDVFVVLDGVQDPGNVGTIARTALALGASGLLTLPGTAEFDSPKALRASMGAAFRLRSIATTAAELFPWLEANGIRAVGTSASGSHFYPAALNRPIALFFGNEGAGLTDNVIPRLAEMVSIPIANGAESLNVAVAAGILLYGVLRA